MHSLTKTFFCGVTPALAWRLLSIPMPWHTTARYTAKAAPDLGVMALPQVDLDIPTATYSVDTANDLDIDQIIGLPSGKTAIHLNYYNDPNSQKVIRIYSVTSTPVERD